MASVDGLNFTFGKGGNQGARGNDEGGDFHVENVFEELDFANEFFFDKAAKKLYLVHNGTGAPPTDDVVVPTLKTLVNATGTQWDPVTDVEHTDMDFKATRYTYRRPRGNRFRLSWLYGTKKSPPAVRRCET